MKKRKRKPKRPKVTPKIESFIIAVRSIFQWWCDRIQKGLWHLPKFMRDALGSLEVAAAQKQSLSLTNLSTTPGSAKVVMLP